MAGCCRQSDVLWKRCCRVGSELFFWSQFAGLPAGCCCFLCNRVYSHFLLLLVTIWIQECKILEDSSPVFIFIFPMHNACLVHFHHCLSGRFYSSLTLPHSKPRPLSESPPSGAPPPELLKTLFTEYLNCLLESGHVVFVSLLSESHLWGPGKSPGNVSPNKLGILFLMWLNSAYCIGRETISGYRSLPVIPERNVIPVSNYSLFQHLDISSICSLCVCV